MKVVALYFVFFLSALVSGSEYFWNSVLESSEFEDQEAIRNEFRAQLVKGNVPAVDKFISRFEFLTQSFDVDIFDGLLECFKTGSQNNHQDCLNIFESLKPSFNDVSESSSTPLIQALIYKNMKITFELLKMPVIGGLIDNVDRFGCTALMYAAKNGNIFAVEYILRISIASINFKDKDGKTALHYACEMDLSSEYNEHLALRLRNWLARASYAPLKWKIIQHIYSKGGEISEEGPEYKLISSDNRLAEFITQSGGKVQIKAGADVFLSRAIFAVVVSRLIKSFGMVQLTTNILSTIMAFILANPVTLALNHACYALQQLIFPGVDMNLVFSLDSGYGSQDISLNIIFMILMAGLIKKAMSI